jgi:large subunit ribosomal protein L13
LTHALFFINKAKFIKRRECNILKKYTYSAKNSDNQGKWRLVNAEGKVLGRLASSVAAVIRGKNNPLFTPHADMGDCVVVINADKVVLTGNKLQQKKYYRHSGYTGGLTTTTAGDLMEKKPEDVIRFAVKGMLPKNRLGKKLIQKLKVYAGTDHPHAAQNPEAMDI